MDQNNDIKIRSTINKLVTLLMIYRTGIGYDNHRFVKTRPLFLGGIRIPSNKGLLGHSDADVLIHAICDALLGAVGAGDIGEHFPDTDSKYKGIASEFLLKDVLGVIAKKGFKVVNIDASLILEEPKLKKYKPIVKKNLSRILKIKESCVNIKAKTNEGLDAIGQKKAAACFAVATVMRKGK